MAGKKPPGWPDDWQQFNGRKVARIDFPQVSDTSCPYVASDDERTLVCHVEYMGDRTEVWVAHMKDGVETARYNVRLAETIVWAA